MQPSDLDVLARIIAEQVKQEADYRFAKLEDQPDLNETIDTLQKQNEDLSESVISLMGSVEALETRLSQVPHEIEVSSKNHAMENDARIAEIERVTKAVENLLDRITATDLKMVDLNSAVGDFDTEHTKRIDTLEELLETAVKAHSTEIADVKKGTEAVALDAYEAHEVLKHVQAEIPFVTKRLDGAMDDLKLVQAEVAKLPVLDDKIKNMISGIMELGETIERKAEHVATENEARTKEIIDVADFVKDTRDKLIDRFDSMIPDEVDLDKAVETVHDLVMKELPEMVQHATPDFPLEKAQQWAEGVAETWCEANVDRIRGAKGDDVDTHEAVEMIIKSDRFAQMINELRPNNLQVAESLKSIYPAIRHDLLMRIPTPTHKGTWSEEIQYDVGDEVVKSGSTFRLMEASSDAPPSPAWQLVSQGSPGKRGKPSTVPGPKGDAGVGVKEIIVEPEEMAVVIEMTNGEVTVFNIKKQVEDIIIKHLSPPEGNDK